jgi:glycosyltransferase involved in cell wall biosynthesis
MGQGGGNLRTLHYIIKYLNRDRFAATILTPMPSDFLQGLRAKGAEVAVLPPPEAVSRYGGRVLGDSLLGRLRTLLGIVRYNRLVAKFLRDRSIDVVYCNSIRALLTVGFAARLTGRPTLWYVKGVLDNGILDRIGFFLASRILFFCESNRDDKYPLLVRWFRRKIGILKIGIDPNVVLEAEARDHTALAAELGLDRSRVNVIILGQVYRPKGVHVVLERFHEVVARHPQAMLWIVGDHVLEEYRPYRAELEAMIESHGLQQHVRFTGWRTDALDVLTLMDVVVHPSLAEGFGRAVLEAMAIGKPVVASRVGGLREIVRDGENGFLCNPGDAPAFQERIATLVADAGLRDRFGRDARREVFEGYLIEDKIAQLQQVWAQMARVEA